jgi:hypothetical protein
VTPQVVEIVFVGKALVRAETEVGETNLPGIVGEADPTGVGDTIGFPMDDEAVEMGIGPAKGALDELVKNGDGAVATDEESAPDERADGTEPNAELVDLELGGNGHRAPRSTQTAGRGAVPSGGSGGEALRGNCIGIA